MVRENLKDGAEGGTRTPTSYLTRPSNVRVYQFRHFGLFQNKTKGMKRKLTVCATIHLLLRAWTWCSAGRCSAGGRRCGRRCTLSRGLRRRRRRLLCRRRFSLGPGRLQHRACTSDSRKRERQRQQHESGSRTDRDLAENALRSARSEGRARNTT